MIPIICTKCGNRGEIEASRLLDSEGKVATRKVRCVRCHSFAIDLDDGTVTAGFMHDVVHGLSDDDVAKANDTQSSADFESQRTQQIEQRHQQEQAEEARRLQAPGGSMPGTASLQDPTTAGFMHDMIHGLDEADVDERNKRAQDSIASDRAAGAPIGGDKPAEHVLSDDEVNQNYQNSMRGTAVRVININASGQANMTRQHFEHIADSISSAPVDAETRVKLANHFADRLSSTNRAFKRDVFVTRASSDPSKRASKVAAGYREMTREEWEAHPYHDTYSDPWGEHPELKGHPNIIEHDPEHGTVLVPVKITGASAPLPGNTKVDVQDQGSVEQMPPGPDPEPFTNPSGYMDPAPLKPGMPTEAKVTEIMDGILATNPGMSAESARHVAIATIATFKTAVAETPPYHWFPDKDTHGNRNPSNSGTTLDSKNLVVDNRATLDEARKKFGDVTEHEHTIPVTTNVK